MRYFILVLVLTVYVPGVHAAPAKRYLALGDSYTIGESVPESGRWPVQLAQRLHVAAPHIIARTGWTTGELDAAITKEDPKGTFDLVTLLIGVNNQYRGRSIDEYRVQFRDLLQRAIRFAGGHAKRVVVVSIPDWGATPYAQGRDRAQIARDIDAFNAVSLEETHRADARYADVTPISRRAASDASLVAGDGLHPSAKMYGEWVNVVLPEARAALHKR